MQFLKQSKSRSSSANVSPVSTPKAHDSSFSPSLSSPSSPNGSKSANRSFGPEKRKSLTLRLPSLSRKSRSKSDIMVAASEGGSPVTLQSPLGKPNSGKNLIAVRSQNVKLVASGRSSFGKTSDPLEEEIKLVFKKFDTNNDGKISAEELCCVLRSLGDNTTEQEAELMIAEVDTDKDGFIDLQEFIDLNMRTGRSSTNGDHSRSSNATDELAAAFEMFDLDKNGCITPDELHCVLGNLGNRTSTLEDCKRMIRGVDRKGSGHVDFDDFKIMMTSSATSIMA